MMLSPYKDKTIAECNGLQFSSVFLSKENQYKCILVKFADGKKFKDEDGKERDVQCLMLSKNASVQVEVGEYPKGTFLIRSYTAEDGSTRFRLGSPELLFKDSGDF